MSEISDCPYFFPMLRVIFKKLRYHLPVRAAYYAAAILMGVLEVLTGVALIWYFFFRDSVALSPMGWAVGGGIYTALSAAYIAVSLPGRMLCFKVQGFFYISVALFFLLKGMMLLADRDFSPWGFYLLWIVLLGITFRETMRDMGEEFGGG